MKELYLLFCIGAVELESCRFDGETSRSRETTELRLDASPYQPNVADVAKCGKELGHSDVGAEQRFSLHPTPQTGLISF